MNISDRRNLIVKIFVFGYPQRGESILILFIDKGYDNKVLYSIVIDSFKYDSINKTIDIMKTYGLDEQKLNMLVWSHPDYDHSYGIKEIIYKYCDEDTIVILPYDLNGKAWNKIKYNKEDEIIVSKILELTKRKFLSHESAAVPRNSYVPFANLMLDDMIGKLPICVSALSPHAARINYCIEEHKTIYKNDLSISLLVEIGHAYKYKLLFMADTENEDIDIMYDKGLENPVFVKIPHHTSSTSDHLIKVLSQARDPLYICCTTTYKSQRLPEKELLSDYMKISKQTDCTGFAKGKNKKYGYVEYTFDFYSDMTIRVKHEGHSCIVDQEFLNSIKYNKKK